MSSNELSTRLTRDFNTDVCTHLNPVSRHIIDADCEYEAGAFKMFCLPERLPNLFTIRFTAPVDFSAGDAITLKGRECAVKTRTMDEPGDGFFKAGAIVHCDIDMERDHAFFAAGGACEKADCPFQGGAVEFYIDPAGANTMATAGTAQDPFKSLAGALRIASQKVIPTLAGDVVFKVNPGVYPAEPLTMYGGNWAAGGLAVRASDPADRPIIGVEGALRFIGGNVGCDGICFETQLGAIVQFTQLHMNDCLVRALSPGTDVVNLVSARMSISGRFEVDGNGQAQRTLLLAQQNATIFGTGGHIAFSNVPSVDLAGISAAWTSSIVMPGTTFSGSFAGSKYWVAGVSLMYVDDKNALPGSVVGTVGSGGVAV